MTDFDSYRNYQNTLAITIRAQAACAAGKWQYSQTGWDWDGAEDGADYIWLHRDGRVTISKRAFPDAVARAKVQRPDTDT